jgi:hypothetical protein
VGSTSDTRQRVVKTHAAVAAGVAASTRPLPQPEIEREKPRALLAKRSAAEAARVASVAAIAAWALVGALPKPVHRTGAQRGNPAPIEVTGEAHSTQSLQKQSTTASLNKVEEQQRRRPPAGHPPSKSSSALMKQPHFRQAVNNFWNRGGVTKISHGNHYSRIFAFETN